MKMPEISLLDWQKKFGTEKACAAALAKHRWPDGFVCPICGHKEGHYMPKRRVYQCYNCRHQAYITAGTLFHSTNLPLVKWFWAIYLVASDKGGISAMRLSKQIGVSWITARRMLQKIRIAMGNRDSTYQLDKLIELDDTYIGGKRSGGKRGRGAAGKKPVLVAVENKGKKAGFMAMEAVETISGESVKQFLNRRLRLGQSVRTDALPALNVVKEAHDHLKKVTPAVEAMSWLPWVHTIIGNLKKFLNGTYHGVSTHYLQEYLDEFCCRFNRRFWEFELPFRLLNACLSQTPIKLTVNC